MCWGRAKTYVLFSLHESSQATHVHRPRLPYTFNSETSDYSYAYNTIDNTLIPQKMSGS